ncbi:MAG TPA: Xaa-Pro peptidase family protein [Candidatus Saccharimonadales bacterium]
MSSLFSSEFFVHNRRRLQEVLPVDVPIVITANGLLQRGADSPYAYAQDANFWYLTGVEEPDVTLVIDGQREFLIAPVREGARATFDGSIDQKKLIKISGVPEVLNEAAGWKRVDELLGKTGRAASLAAAPNYIEQYGMYSNPARLRLHERLHKHVPELEIVDIRVELARLRMIKLPAELKAIQKAIDITTASLKDAFTGDRQRYTYEYELEAEVAAGFRKRGAAGHSFEPIVAGGKRACTLHNVANESRLKHDEIVVVDVGAEYQHYAADITRTIALQKPSQRQKDVYNAVLEVQQFATDLLKPGITLRAYEHKVADRMAKELKTLGLIKTKSQVREYFPHATSHYLGLNVHDVGDYEKPLQPGIVLTVEPGIYIPEEGIGVRIEDDALITENGAVVLSDRLPRKLF